MDRRANGTVKRHDLYSVCNEACQLHAFEQQPTPIIILSEIDIVVFANLAARKLFQGPRHLVGRHVHSLPLLWQDGSVTTFHELLTPKATGKYEITRTVEDEGLPDLLRLQVEIHRDLAISIISSSLLVTSFSFAGQDLRMLSFEGTREIDDKHPNHARNGERHLATSLPERTRINSGEHYAGVQQVMSHSRQEYLNSRFAQFRDAIYFNNRDSAGFILSADETFCVPNYREGEAPVPVEIKNIEQFFGNWDVWNPNFTEPEPLTEYPSIWLNRHREKFTKRRYGLREGAKQYLLEASGHPLYNQESGEYIGGIVYLNTLGEYEEVVVKDLEASLSDFRTICDRLPHLLWTVNAEGQADYFSQSWYDFTGLSEEESLGLAFQKSIQSDDMQKIWEAFAEASVTQSMCTAEARYRRHDGQWIWMSVRAKPFLNPQGQVLKWYGTSTEIHNLVVERLQAEKQKRQVMQMLALADVGLFEVSPDWRLKVIEGRMQWLEQQSSADILTALHGFVDDDGARDLSHRLQDVMATSTREATFESKIQSRWYKFRLVADNDELMRSKIFGCSVDITEQRKYAALESENARLFSESSLVMEKSRIKTAFLANMSHEIRTPIAGIMGNADLLAEVCVGEEQREVINDIQISANSLLTIVNDILDLSKVEAGKLTLEMTSFNLYQTVLEVKKHFISIARNRSLSMTCCQDLSGQLMVVSDPGRIKQILMNLVSNAVKFTSKGSIKFSVTKQRDKIKIDVEDTGDGIDDHTMSTLFKPFVQGDASTARRHGGTGLGLTISRNLAELMGGSLFLQSCPGEGTVATLTLPNSSHLASSQTPEVSRTRSRTRASVRQDTPTQNRESEQRTGSDDFVLIAEDNAINQKVVLNLVRKFGYRTQAVCNGQEVLDYVLNSGPPSLILMDCQMPLLDGYSATRELRNNDKYRVACAVPVIALTASAIQGDREKCFAAGMDDYLSKPISKRLLQDMLDKWLCDP